MARPSLITAEVTLEREGGVVQTLRITDAICMLVGGGASMENAAMAVGLDHSTLYGWLRRGKKQEGKARVVKAEQPFYEFFQDLTRARGRNFVWHETNWRRGAQKDARLSMEYMARTQPSRYARREVEDDPGEREPAPLNAATAKEVEESFDAAFLPPGVDADAFLLPAAAEDEEA